MGSMTASGDPRRWAVDPGVPGIVRVFDPYCYRCPFGQKVETHTRQLQRIERLCRRRGRRTFRRHAGVCVLSRYHSRDAHRRHRVLPVLRHRRVGEWSVRDAHVSRAGRLHGRCGANRVAQQLQPRLHRHRSCGARFHAAAAHVDLPRRRLRERRTRHDRQRQLQPGDERRSTRQRLRHALRRQHECEPSSEPRQRGAPTRQIARRDLHRACRAGGTESAEEQHALSHPDLGRHSGLRRTPASASRSAPASRHPITAARR